ncbi:hypothetical protein M3Y95_00540400 [Aphelenchoides besseyi]|nr:hypothetical protein M3Y95_00540400 [Aphelenchoides besseyi]
MSRYDSAPPSRSLTSTEELKRVILSLWKIDIGNAMVSGETQKAMAMADIGYEVVNFTVKRLKGSVSNLPTLIERIQMGNHLSTFNPNPPVVHRPIDPYIPVESDPTDDTPETPTNFDWMQNYKD